MLPRERQYKIVELLIKNKSLTVKELCDELESSEATIRRDLTILESEGKLERTHGGAMLASFTIIDKEETYNQKENLFVTEKQRIAKKAFSMLKDGETIIIDAGTTALELASLIGESNLRLNVITNSTTITKTISENVNVELFIIGGRVRLNTLATVGALAIDTINAFNVSKTFLGVNGITFEGGLTTPDFEEAQVKKAMLTVAKERIVLADHSKFNKVTACRIAPLSMVDYIITDNSVSENVLDEFSEDNINIIIA